MKFLIEEDLLTVIDKKILDMLNCRTNRTDECEEMAMGFIEGDLSSRYDLKQEFAKQYEARNRTLVRWMSFLVVYYLYNTVQDTEIPERVEKNYDDVRREVEKIAGGKGSTDLIPITVNGQVKTSFKYGSSPKRTHNPFGGY